MTPKGHSGLARRLGSQRRLPKPGDISLAACVPHIRPADFDFDRVVEDAIQNRPGGNGIAQVIRPVLFFDVGGKDQ